MPALFRYWIYGSIVSVAAIFAGLLAGYVFDFHWAIVSLALLGLANVFVLSDRHHRYGPNFQPAPTQAGTTLVNAIIQGEKPLRHVPNRNQPKNRYTWISQPTIVAAIVIVVVVLLA